MIRNAVSLIVILTIQGEWTRHTLKQFPSKNRPDVHSFIKLCLFWKNSLTGWDVAGQKEFMLNKSAYVEMQRKITLNISAVMFIVFYCFSSCNFVNILLLRFVVNSNEGWKLWFMIIWNMQTLSCGNKKVGQKI